MKEHVVKTFQDFVPEICSFVLTIYFSLAFFSHRNPKRLMYQLKSVHFSLNCVDSKSAMLRVKMGIPRVASYKLDISGVNGKATIQ